MPSSAATMRSTEEVSASPYFSSSRLMGMFLLKMESRTSLPMVQYFGYVAGDPDWDGD